MWALMYTIIKASRDTHKHLSQMTLSPRHYANSQASTRARADSTHSSEGNAVREQGGAHFHSINVILLESPAHSLRFWSARKLNFSRRRQHERGCT